MSQLKDQKQQIEDINTARYISGTLRDISAIELGALMKRFGKNNMFYGELTDLYQLVWRISQQHIAVDAPREHKALYVAYTTNRHFYGALNRNIMESFRERTGTNDHCLIVGDTGRQIWMSQYKKRRKIDYLSFVGDTPTAKERHAFIDSVSEYDRVFVFYPRFVTVFTQEADVVDISFQPPEVEPGSDTRSESIQYLLEPDIEEMITFFNTQVRNALFERILLETQLSRVAARLVKMDTADQNAEALLVRSRQALRQAYTSIASRQMLETLVGYIQWHKKNVPHIVQ